MRPDDLRAVVPYECLSDEQSIEEASLRIIQAEKLFGHRYWIMIMMVSFDSYLYPNSCIDING